MLLPSWLILACVWFIPQSAWALDPSKRISQYAHTAWRLQDGFFTGSPVRIVQTKDGYVWLGTTAGLLRFDGLRFVAWNSERAERLLSSQVRDLLAARDGSLWIMTDGGLSRWKDQRLTHHPGTVGTLLEDRRGTIWIAQSVPSPGSGALCRMSETGIRCLGSAEGGPDLKGPGAMIEDAHGNIWIGDGTRLHRWSTGSHGAYQTPGLMNNPAEGVLGLAAAADGAIWVGIGNAGPGLGLQRLVNGRWEAFQTPELDGTALTVTTLRLDREGALWIGTGDRGIYRLHDNRVDHFDRRDGLSSDTILSFSEDDEGNLWVGTSQGVHRFSDTPVISFSAREGLCSPEVVSVAAGRDGTVWVGGHGGLSHLRDGRFSCLRTGKGLPGTQPTALLEDQSGRLWAGIDNNLWTYEDGKLRRITRPDGGEIGFVTGLAEDSEHRIWVVVGRPRRTLMRIDGTTVQEVAPELHMPRRVAAAAGGGIWIGTVNGDLAHYRDGTLSTYKAARDDASLLNQLLSGDDGSVLAATSYGLTGWHNGKLLHLDASRGLPCDAVNAFTRDRTGNLWLFMDCALGHISRADLEKWKANPPMRVSVRTYDAADGVRPGWAPFDAGATSSDGRLWFANSNLLQTIDPARPRRNTVPPPVHIAQIIADRTRYPAGAVVHLPPLTRDLEIDYVGLSFVAPQKVLFRYRLEGRDDTWQEPGTRRQAFYNDLDPGTYRFRVVASNNDGVWNEQGAAVNIVIAPAWYQTTWFLLLCVATSILVMWALYQLRVRQLARSLNARFDERLAERTRMARDLHDTLLQTVQGSKMVADNALTRPEDADGMLRAMEQLSGWLGQASTEGRAAVIALRQSTRETNDLAEALDRAIEDCRRQGSLHASLSVSGNAREMHPVVRDEIYRIAYEAIRNACTHSGGSRLEVALTYAHDLIVRVSDDGVGIEPAVAGMGREGHFGLQGMRERAARIGARLTVVSSSSAGTEIEVIVPGRVIFHRQATGLFARMRARLTS